MMKDAVLRGILPPRALVTRAIVYLPEFKLAYLNNPKVACSTIKSSMWRAADEKAGQVSFDGKPHRRARSPFVKTAGQMGAMDREFAAATLFTIVRNPFSRFLSAYLDKIASPTRDPRVWPEIAPLLGFDHADRPSLGAFLERLAHQDPETVDPHFAPQYVNVLADYITPDFTGYLEDMESVMRFLARHGIPLRDFNIHRTDASSHVAAHYGPNEIRLVRKIYAKDFDLFGYRDTPSHLEATEPAPQCDSARANRRRKADFINEYAPSNMRRSALAKRSLYRRTVEALPVPVQILGSRIKQRFR